MRTTDQSKQRKTKTQERRQDNQKKRLSRKNGDELNCSAYAKRETVKMAIHRHAKAKDRIRITLR